MKMKNDLNELKDLDLAPVAGGLEKFAPKQGNGPIKTPVNSNKG
jgi:hypothetical protein